MKRPDSPGRKHELAPLCDSDGDLQPSLPHTAVFRSAQGEMETLKCLVCSESVVAKGP